MSAFQSHSFPMSNGTRQGCPLSPLLFILCLEPLAETIHAHPDIKGVLIRQREYKHSIQDNLLLTLTNPLLSLPSLHDLLSTYRASSNPPPLNFIRHNRAHRIASSVVLSSHIQGDLGVPDIVKYFYATPFRTIAPWLSQYAPNGQKLRWVLYTLFTFFPWYGFTLSTLTRY